MAEGDPAGKRMKGITPIISTIVLLLITVALAGAAWAYISGFFGAYTKVVDIPPGSTYFDGSNVNIMVRNIGTSAINTSSCTASGNAVTCGDLTLTREGGGVPNITLSSDGIEPGKAIMLKDTDCQAGNVKYTLTSPSSVYHFDVYSGSGCAGNNMSGICGFADTLFLANGNVGIGTTGPTSHLTIIDAGNTVAGQQIRIGQAIGTNDYTFGRNPTTGFLDFNGTQTGYIGYTFSNGNVGIGTTSPSRNLEVVGGIMVSGTRAEYYHNNTAGGSNEKIWKVVAGEAAENLLEYKLVNDALSDSNNYMVVERSGYTVTDVSFPSGNVGIGAANPSYKLQVQGAAATSVDLGIITDIGTHAADYWVLKGVNSDNSFRILSGGKTWPLDDTNSAVMSMTSAGNVGIGTTGPTAKLDVNGATGYNQLRLRVPFTPTGTADVNGNVGDVSWDSNYIYVKTSSGWKRAALTNF